MVFFHVLWHTVRNTQARSQRRISAATSERQTDCWRNPGAWVSASPGRNGGRGSVAPAGVQMGWTTVMVDSKRTLEVITVHVVTTELSLPNIRLSQFFIFPGFPTPDLVQVPALTGLLCLLVLSRHRGDTQRPTSTPDPPDWYLPQDTRIGTISALSSR